MTTVREDETGVSSEGAGSSEVGHEVAPATSYRGEERPMCTTEWWCRFPSSRGRLCSPNQDLPFASLVAVEVVRSRILRLWVGARDDESHSLRGKYECPREVLRNSRSAPNQRDPDGVTRCRRLAVCRDRMIARRVEMVARRVKKDQFEKNCS